jgi:hypothetical protein
VAGEGAALPGERPVSGRSSLAVLAAALLALALAPVPAQAEFGIAAATASLRGSDGEPLLAAGAHPDLTIEVSLNATRDSETGAAKPEGNPRSIELRLPPGRVGNPRAVPTCSRSELVAERCDEAQAEVGRLTVQSQGEELEASLFNLTPPPGAVGRLGVSLFGVPVFIDFGIAGREEGYALTARISSLPQIAPIEGAELTLWGEPHPERAPLITNPTECTGEALAFSARIDSYQRPEVLSEERFDRDSQGNPLVVEACEALPFEAALAVRPTSAEADSPSGLDLAFSMPQRSRPRASALLEDAVVTLPEGMTVNPATAAGLASCSPVEADLDGAGPARCPLASQIGTARIVSPLLAEPLPGAIHLARQGENELGALLAVYLTVDDPHTGTVLKLIGRVDADPRTGRLAIAFHDLPQLPFESLDLSLFGGPLAPLKTPAACGRFGATAELAPRSRASSSHVVASFEIASGPGGSACPGGRFAPWLRAGSTDPLAGAFSPFLLRLRRPPATQALGGVALRLPRGLLARVAGIPYCPDAALAAIPTGAGTGASQLATPACPFSSRVGGVVARVGAGPDPFSLETGAAYLAGPYRGAPFSLVLVAPAVAGPFDLGNAVVRVALHVDPRTARIRAVSDPLPTILHGIPLELRELRVQLDRDRFMLNPTSCARMRVGAGVVSAAGAAAWLRNRFQVTGCRGLEFAPRLALRLRGGSERGAYPALTARLKARAGEAHLRRLTATLPPSLRLAPEHIGTICTRTRWAERTCPSGSVYGTAEARTPLLARPLRGSVYLRSSDHELPDLVADVRGQIDLELVGRVSGSRGRLRVTFAGLPDAPVRGLTLRMRGGAQGLIVNGTDLCRTRLRAAVEMDGQNGALHDLGVPMRSASC